VKFMSQLVLVAIVTTMPVFPQQQENAIGLSAVKTIYIPVVPPAGRENSAYWSNPDNIDFQNLLFRSLVKWDRAPKNDPQHRIWIAEGDCKTEIPTIIPGVKLVCEQNQGDVELLGYVAGDPVDVTSTTGTVTQTGQTTATIQTQSQTNRYYRFDGGALIFDLPGGQKVWEVAKSGHNEAQRALWTPILGNPGLTDTPADVASRIVNQLRKDILSARKSDSRSAR
jgi:hypothetical protein